jgi:FKBP-type peptidyl-prolyl cis-trans isomerase 2
LLRCDVPSSSRIHETTTLADGTLIYSTRTNDQPLRFLLGGNQVIEGVDEGVKECGSANDAA